MFLYIGIGLIFISEIKKKGDKLNKIGSLSKRILHFRIINLRRMIDIPGTNLKQITNMTYWLNTIYRKICIKSIYILLLLLYITALAPISLALAPDPSSVYRPLVGGARIEIGCGFLCLVVCFIGFTGYVTATGSSYPASYGISSAGHCGSVGQYIYQPAWSLFVDNHVATISKDEDTYIDGLYAVKRDNVDITNKVLKCSSTGYARVAGLLSFSEVRQGLDQNNYIPVSKYGSTTWESGGYITRYFYSISIYIEGRGVVTYYYQLVIEGMKADKGDSGSPVYEDPYVYRCTNFEHEARAAGILWGGNSTHVFATSIDGLKYYVGFVPLTG